jgi:hypothetical protein
MRMPSGPWDFGCEAARGRRDSSYLEPSEDDVKLRRATNEAKCISDLFGVTKASKEEKQIAAVYLVASEMALRGSSLSEDWAPSRGARDRFAAQIGIEMRAVASVESAACQGFDNPGDWPSVERPNIPVSRRRSRIRNRKRAQPTVQYWVWTSAVRRVETLAAEDEFHLSRIAQPCYTSRPARDKENFHAGF